MKISFDSAAVSFYAPSPRRLSPSVPPIGELRLNRSRRVLIVDSSRESREILRTLLRRAGAETLEAAHAGAAAEMADRLRPDLIVFDSDDHLRSPDLVAEDLGRVASRSSIPIVVLGTARRHLTPLVTRQFVSKPYHYRPLIRRIEEILGTKAEQLA